MELPAMNEGLLDDEEDENKWEPPIRNLDKFFTSMYNYHNSKGLPTILITQLCSTVSLAFTTSFSTFLIGFVDWSALKNCHDEVSCGNISHYICSNPFTKFSFLRNLFILIYSIILSTYWIWKTYHSCRIVTRAIQMEKFYREKLGIHVSNLQNYSWDDIVQKLIQLHDQGIHRVVIKDKLNEHDIVLRIMRKDNYMIGLINKNILDLRVPWWLAPFISERLFLTKSLEWSLSFCIMEYMFNDQFIISSLFLKDINGLQGRFILVGIIHLTLLPIMIIFMSISFFLQNAQSFHSNKAYLGPRQWSSLALWAFREFNELPHIFEARMNKSYVLANEYLSLFYNINAAVIARSISYISGSFIATLLLLSFLAEGVFLYVDIWEHNFLWWLGIFSAIYAGSRSLIPDETKLSAHPEQLMIYIASYTHYFPVTWLNKCHTIKVRDEFEELFPFKVKVFIMEVLSVVLTPIVLCFSLPKCAPSIIDFIRDHSRYVEGVGAVCDYSLFDFDQYGNENYGAPSNGYTDPSRKPEHGKLEQSYINFKQHHPHWQGGGVQGQALLQKLSIYKQMREHEKDAQVADMIHQSIYPTSSSTNQPLPPYTNIPMVHPGMSPFIPPNYLNPAPMEQGLDNVTYPSNCQLCTIPQQVSKSSESIPIDMNKQPYTESSDGNKTNMSSNTQQIINGHTVGLVNGTWTQQGYTSTPNTTLHEGASLPTNTEDNHIYTNNNNNNTMPSVPPPPPPQSTFQRAEYEDPSYSHLLQSIAPSHYPTSMNNTPTRPVHSMLSANNNNTNINRPHVSSILRSILKNENIDYDNDFYWLQRFQMDKIQDSVSLERSLLPLPVHSPLSMSLMNRSKISNIYNTQNMYPSYYQYSHQQQQQQLSQQQQQQQQQQLSQQQQYFTQQQSLQQQQYQQQQQQQQQQYQSSLQQLQSQNQPLQYEQYTNSHNMNNIQSYTHHMPYDSTSPTSPPPHVIGESNDGHHSEQMDLYLSMLALRQSQDSQPSSSSS